MTDEESTTSAVSDNKHTPVSNYNTLVISGGSVKGFAILGALQYAYDNSWLKNVTTYIGTSVGSMICYLLCIGYTPIEIMVYLCTHQMLDKIQNFDLVSLLQGRGASSFNYLGEHLEKMTISKIGYLPTMLDLYEKMGKSLICSTHNLTESRTEYLKYQTHPRLPCITALHMSSNIPLIFERYKYGTCLYVDGGISDNFPIQLVDKPENKVLGILLSENKVLPVEGAETTNGIEYLFYILRTAIRQSFEYKMAHLTNACEIVSIPVTHRPFEFFKFDLPSSSKLDLFSQGYEHMRVTYYT